MRFARSLAHLFFPRESNNQKAKILHSSSLALFVIFLVFYQVVLSSVSRFGPQVLGYAANISPEEIIRLTNEKRVANGLLPLEANSNLSSGAQAKGTDMLAKEYWAHISPDGNQPWKFFADVGYKYRYAGENLARDFSDPKSVVEAWMSSSSHKENLLSPKYKDIGVAVVEGNLAGVDTTIVVQFFGSKYVDTIPAVPIAKSESVKPPSGESQLGVASTLAAPNPQPQKIASISPFKSTQSISLALVIFLLLVMAIDVIVVSRKRIVRIGGRALAHISFMGMILTILLIARGGIIL